jgi:4,5-DOPA dioxygenase extradiol
MGKRLPTVFFGHGNPMNALLQNRYTAGWAAIGRDFAKPKAVLCISAHWYLSGSALTVNTAPRTIHDFGGFPPELYQVSYPAPGDPDLALRVKQLLAPIPVDLDQTWGLDHGTWSVLRHVYPDADVPVVQLSIAGRRAGRFHYEIGQRLAPLREEGVLIAGSGNIVHNLRAFAWEKPAMGAYDWAARFEGVAKELLLSGQHADLIDYERLGKDAKLSIPTAEHYLPLLYVLGAGIKGEPVEFPIDGIDGGSVSMLTIRLG